MSPKSNVKFFFRNVFNKDELGLEIAHIALPSALALTADPIASLIDTAFIGHIGLFFYSYIKSKAYNHDVKFMNLSIWFTFDQL